MPGRKRQQPESIEVHAAEEVEPAEPVSRKRAKSDATAGAFTIEHCKSWYAAPPLASLCTDMRQICVQDARCEGIQGAD